EPSGPGRPAPPDGGVNTPGEVGVDPAHASDPADVPADGDHDGMPDDWETQHGFDPADPADGAQDADGDGYTNVEEFLNGTNPREHVDYRNLGNNIDTISG
ncbi:MAG TPA: hypothetical protein PJ982_17380, partial [Lacipirellulaceae bacterium]|nr:hypothetical protein [Lacipirellulaceae bacterium]